jgi:predicted transcriptional regulator
LFEITLLHNLKITRDEKELSRMTNVGRKIVKKTLDELFEAGYIGKDSLVTEKGFDFLNQPSVPVRSEAPIDLSALETLLLRNINGSMGDKAFSKMAQVDRATISAKLDRLYDLDLITYDLMLTKKGYNILHQIPKRLEPIRAADSSRVAQAREQKSQERVVVIQREVVKVPCSYCGMLLDPMRDAVCPSCGANLEMPRK